MNLPNSWESVTIAQYHKLISIFSVYKEVIERDIHLLTLFSGKPMVEIEAITGKDFVAHASKLKFLYDLPDGKVTTHFELKDKKYRACILTEDMKAGQFIDFSNCGKGASAEEIPYHMHELIACMCQQQVDGKYVYVPYNKTSDDFLDMPMSTAYPYYVFFCNVLRNLQQPILDYSLKIAKREMKKVEIMLA